MSICASCGKSTCEHIGISGNPEETGSALASRPAQSLSANAAYIPAGPRVQEKSDGKSIAGPSVVYGAKGDRGDTGATGPEGKPGKAGRDADVREVVEAARQTMKSEVNQFVEAKLSEFQSGLRNLIVQLLQERNVLDVEGKAVPGPTGKDGTP